MGNRIITINNKKDERFLRTPVPAFDFKSADRKQLKVLVKDMRLRMKQANGIGLSANQIGLSVRFFVSEVSGKFYAVFNPQIKKFSSGKTVLEEGCLSVPETYGQAARPERISLEGYDVNGRKIKIKAWGLLARVFQHETDHLNGVLFIDRAEKVTRLKQK